MKYTMKKNKHKTTKFLHGLDIDFKVLLFMKFGNILDSFILKYNIYIYK